MKKFTFILLLISITLSVHSQSAYWADTVLDYSSQRKLSHHYAQLHPNAFSAQMVLGEPNIMPGNEGTGKAWTPNTTEEKAFIKVGFEKPDTVRQIAIAEVFNVSAISNIWLYTSTGKEIHLDFFNPRSLPIPGRLFLIFIDPTQEPIKAIKVELDNQTIPGRSGIDAIGFSNSYEPIEIFAKVADGIHTALDPEKLGENINSKYKDIKPLLSPDGNTMYFSRIEHPNNTGGEDDLEDIWFSKRDPTTGEWGPAENVGSNLNTEGPNFVASIAQSGYTYQLLLGNQYGRNGKMSDGLSLTTKTSEGFMEPININIEGWENYDEHANFYLSSDGRTILMSVQRRDTHGDRDIYVTFLKQGNDWSIPLNLGRSINSSEEESAPFLSEDGKTLFFSSKGHLGYGGADVFMSKRLDDTWTNWTEPENLGTAINSKEDDLFFYLTSSDKKYAYFTRGDGKDADIYRLLLPIFQLPDPVVVMKGRVLNSKTLEPIEDARITFRDKESRVVVNRQYSEMVTGKYMVHLPLGKYYDLYASKENFISIEKKEVDLSHVYDPDTIESDILLDPIEVGDRFSLDNIYFDFDRAVLKEESTPQLEMVYEFLVENPNVKIEIDGHTCNMGSDDYNKKLSENRAKSVLKYLTKRGIANKRIESKGFGEASPITTNETEEGRETNRRVEFVILEK